LCRRRAGWDSEQIVTAHRLTTSIAALVAALAVGACGESAQDKAKKQVCSARSDIAKQVGTLQDMTITTATMDQLRKSLQAIGNDLKQIKDAQSDLSSDRQDQIKSANQAFESQVKEIVSGLGSNLSLSNAESQLKSAMQQLASSYQQTFAKVDCS
jgi:uncharacterized phage infection (PIP) family protein YhgE